MKIKNKKLFQSLRENTMISIKIYSNLVSKSIILAKLSRIITKYFYFFGIGSALNRYDNSLTLYSAFADKRLYIEYNIQDKFINFGSGAFFHKRWKNYDYPGQTEYYKAIQGINGKDFAEIDLCAENLTIPEDDESVTLIYCAHTLEHLDKQSSIRFLRECFRIMKKNGVMRLALPNTRNDFYLLRCIEAQKKIEKELRQNYIRDAAFHMLADTSCFEFEELEKLLNLSSFESLSFYNDVIRQYPKKGEFNPNYPERHINYWDLSILIEITERIGFKCVIPTYLGSSIASPFENIHVFDTTEPHTAFYAEIIK